MLKAKAEEKFKGLIRDLWDREIYPSVLAINRDRGRTVSAGLNGRECKWRREIFKELGIRMRSGPYGDKSDNERSGYNYAEY